MAQFYVGRKSLVIDIFGMSTEKEFVNTLEDIIRKRGAMDKLITDSARVEISRRVQDILRSLIIDDWQSEPNYQHQNFAEHRWRHFKRNIQWYMNWRNVDPTAWLLCARWIADVMNHTAEKSLGWRPPLQVLTGQTIDISIILCFLFWDVVYCTRYKEKDYKGQIGSTKSSEIRGRFVGFAWDVGHMLTFKILTDDTKKIICRSRIRLSEEATNNLKLDTEAGAVPERIYIRSKRDGNDQVILPTIDMSTNPFDIEDPVPDANENGENTAHQHVPTKGNSGETLPEPIKTKNGEPPKEAPLPTQVETVDEHEEEEGHSPMDDVPLSGQPTVETVDDEEDLADHLRQPKRKPGESTLILESLRTDNPTEPNKPPPDQMLERTFLMPPEEDGTRV